MPNYRPGSTNNLHLRMQGMGVHSSGMLYGAPDKAFQSSIKTAIKDEVNAIFAYETLIRDVQVSPISVAERARIIDVLTHIRNQEVQHKALLERILIQVR